MRRGGPLISKREGRLAIHVVPTDEELMIARHKLALLSNSQWVTRPAA